MTDGTPTRRRVLTGLAAAGAGGLALSGTTGGLASATTGRDGARRTARTDTEERWPMFGNNPRNTGRTLETGPEDGVEIGWETDVAATTPPAIAGSTLYVGTADGLSTFDVADREAGWSVETPSPVTTCPAVGDGSVFVGTEDGTVHAFSATDGEADWTYETDDTIAAAPTYVGSEEQLYVGTESGTVYKIEAPSGFLTWDREHGDSVAGAIAVAEDKETAYVPRSDGNVYGLDYSTGRHNRFTFSQGDEAMRPVAIDRRFAYVADAEGALHEFDSRNGSHHWTRSLSGAVQGGVTYLYSDVYAATDDGNVYAYDTDLDVDDDAVELWNVELDEGIVSTPVMAQGREVLYLGGEDGTVFAIDIQDGEELWRASLSIGAVDVVLFEGTLWAVGDGLVAIDPGAETAIAQNTPTLTATPTATPTATATPTTTATPAEGTTETGTPTVSPTATATATGTDSSPTATETDEAGGAEGGGGTVDSEAATMPPATASETDTPATGGDGPDTTSGSGPLPVWLTLAGVGGLAALGLRRADAADDDSS